MKPLVLARTLGSRRSSVVGVARRMKHKPRASAADAVVVGSALVDQIGSALERDGRASPGLVESVLERVRALAAGVSKAERAAA